MHKSQKTLSQKTKKLPNLCHLKLVRLWGFCHMRPRDWVSLRQKKKKAINFASLTHCAYGLLRVFQGSFNSTFYLLLITSHCLQIACLDFVIVFLWKVSLNIFILPLSGIRNPDIYFFHV